jgi:hypothetical protein
MGSRTLCSAFLIRQIPLSYAILLTIASVFFASYGAIPTPVFGVVEAYGDNTTELNNALVFFMIRKSIFSLYVGVPLTQLQYGQSSQ